MHAVEKRDTQLVVEKLNYTVKIQCVWWEEELAACSETLCLIHAVKRRDTQLVVGQLDFAMENPRV
jgi:hypothetical protein